MYAYLYMFYGFLLQLCTDSVYVYGFCLRLCKDFAHVVLILHMYTTNLLHKLCRFCVRIHIFVRVERLCVHIRLIFCDVTCVTSQGIRSSGFFYLDCLCERSWFIDSLKDPLLRVPSSSFSAQAAHYYWTVSRIQYWGFCRVLFPQELLIIIGPYQVSHLEGSVKFFFWQYACDSPSDLTLEVLLLIFIE